MRRHLIYFTNNCDSEQIARQVLDSKDTISLLRQGPFLEAGCGTGNILKALSRISRGIDIRGIDYNLEYLEEARKDLRGLVTLIHGNIRGMPFESGSVPVVLTKNVYKPFNTGETCRAMVKEILRIMPVGGQYFCYDDSGDHMDYLREFGCEIGEHDLIVVKQK